MDLNWNPSLLVWLQLIIFSLKWYKWKLVRNTYLKSRNKLRLDLGFFFSENFHMIAVVRWNTPPLCGENGRSLNVSSTVTNGVLYVALFRLPQLPPLNVSEEVTNITWNIRYIICEVRKRFGKWLPLKGYFRLTYFTVLPSKKKSC